jgi:FKBP-type peptidyl-prolyl cis-trans isomerase 2
MKIAKNSIVLFHHKMTDQDGEIIENSAGQEPSAFLYGHKNMIETLEHSMSGKEAGDKFCVTLQPEMAYGRLNLKNRLRVARKSIGQEYDSPFKDSRRDSPCDCCKGWKV